MPAKRTSTGDRLQSLLNIIPWVAAQAGPTVDEVCERFGVKQDVLLDDLTMASMVGVYPHTPDELVEVVVEDGRVWVHYAAAFRRPTTRVPGVRLHPWQLGEGDPIVARVLVDADQAPMAVQYAGADAVAEQREDGAVVLEMAVTNRSGFRSFVLGFLEHAEVLEPPELRDDIVEWFGALA